jgi:hypothetical protein
LTFGRLEAGEARRAEREVDVLPVHHADGHDADHLAAHVEDGAPGIAVRDGRGDLDDAAQGGHLAHGRDDAVRDGAFEPERVADDEDALALLGHDLRERGDAGTLGRHLDAEQREVALLVEGREPGHHVSLALALEGAHLGAGRALDDVEVRQDLPGPDEEAAPGERDLARGVVGDDGDHRGLDAADEFGE